MPNPAVSSKATRSLHLKKRLTSESRELTSRRSHPSWGRLNHFWISVSLFLSQCPRLEFEVGSRSLKKGAFYQEPNFLVQCFGCCLVKHCFLYVLQRAFSIKGWLCFRRTCIMSKWTAASQVKAEGGLCFLFSPDFSDLTIKIIYHNDVFIVTWCMQTLLSQTISLIFYKKMGTHRDKDTIKLMCFCKNTWITTQVHSCFSSNLLYVHKEILA